jgi:hypothetical protein
MYDSAAQPTAAPPIPPPGRSAPHAPPSSEATLVGTAPPEPTARTRAKPTPAYKNAPSADPAPVHRRPFTRAMSREPGPSQPQPQPRARAPQSANAAFSRPAGEPARTLRSKPKSAAPAGKTQGKADAQAGAAHLSVVAEEDGVQGQTPTGETQEEDDVQNVLFGDGATDADDRETSEALRRLQVDGGGEFSDSHISDAELGSSSPEPPSPPVRRTLRSATQAQAQDKGKGKAVPRARDLRSKTAGKAAEREPSTAESLDSGEVFPSPGTRAAEARQLGVGSLKAGAYVAPRGTRAAAAAARKKL